MNKRVCVLFLALEMAVEAKGFNDYFYEYLMRTSVGLTVNYSRPIGRGVKRAVKYVFRAGKRR